jgi:hypothetical protein
MNEKQFAFTVRHYLNLSAEQIDRKTTDRLYAARQLALKHHRLSAEARLAGAGRVSLEVVLSHARTVATLVALALVVAGIYVWNSVDQASRMEEIDSALLADELPIKAYLDRGFDAWLKDTSQQ